MFLLSAVHFCWFGTYSRGGEYPQIYFSITTSKILLHFIRKFWLSKNTSKLETLLIFMTVCGILKSKVPIPFLNLISFVPCIVIFIIYMYQHMHTNCIKLHIICVYIKTVLHVFANNCRFWIDVSATKYKINVSNSNSQC